MQGRQVMAKYHLRLTPQRLTQSVCIDVRVAVTVPANPLSHLEKRMNRLLAKPLFEIRIESRDFRQECGLVVAQRILNLVYDSQLRERSKRVCHNCTTRALRRISLLCRSRSCNT